MNALAEAPTGSTNAESAPNIKPTTIRRIEGSIRWIVPSSDLKNLAAYFQCGLMHDVTFEPNDTVMKEVSCGGARISEASTTGILEIANDGKPSMPDDAVRACSVGYDSVRKVFHDKAVPDVVITKADYLVLLPDGQSIAGWKQEP
jgi:hypothetical protein